MLNLTCMRGAFLATAMVLSATAFGQNLIANASFEANNGLTGQGRMPTSWQAVNSSPDGYTNDGSFGLAPGAFGNFTGITAQDGIAWVAGWSAGPESFGQVLATPLVAGESYDLSGWLRQAVRSDLDDAGGYDVRLVTSTSNTLLGRLGNTVTGAWVQRSFNFVAPSTTGTQTLVFVPVAIPGGSAYPGLDNVSLQAVPEPGSMVALGAALLAFAKRRKVKSA